MSLRKISFSILFFTLSIVSCNNDDDGDGPVVEPQLTFEAQQAADDAIIRTYLETHYYNANVFEDATSRIGDLVITEDQVEGSVNLMQAVTQEQLVIGGVTILYYYLNLENEAVQQNKATNSPTFADRVRVIYRGTNLSNGVVFDDKITSPTTFDITNTIIGWQNIIPNFKAATGFSVENDGVVNFNSPGMGLMFIPSTIAYFSLDRVNNLPPRIFRPLVTETQAQPVLRRPLMFEFELLQVFENDTDEDGIPSHLEDLNGDEFFNLDGNEDNTDGDTSLNVEDEDDDNDGVLTRDEIVISFVEETTRDAVLNTNLETNQFLANFIEEIRNEAGDITGFRGRIITFFDTDNDGVFNHLDPDDATVITEL